PSAVCLMLRGAPRCKPACGGWWPMRVSVRVTVRVQPRRVSGPRWRCDASMACVGGRLAGTRAGAARTEPVVGAGTFGCCAIQSAALLCRYAGFRDVAAVDLHSPHAEHYREQRTHAG